MLTGEIRTQVDAIWNAFCSEGHLESAEAIEQITYPLFIRRLDELQLNEGIDSHVVTTSDARRHVSRHSQLSRPAA